MTISLKILFYYQRCMISGSIDMRIRKLEFEEINYSRKKEETIENKKLKNLERVIIKQSEVPWD